MKDYMGYRLGSRSSWHNVLITRWLMSTWCKHSMGHWIKTQSPMVDNVAWGAFMAHTFRDMIMILEGLFKLVELDIIDILR